MEKTSNVSALSERLKQKMEEDSSQQRELILSEQEKLLSDLKNTYSAALNTTLSGIRESLKSRLGDMAMLTAQEAQTVEKMVEQHQEKLSNIMLSHYSQAAEAIKSQSDPAAESLDRLTASLNKATAAAERSAKVSRRRWIIGLIVGLSAFLIISGASWGLLRYLFGQVQQNLATIDLQNQTIRRLHDQTMGLQIIEAQNGMFLILPPGAQNGYSVGDKPAIKLPTN